MEGKLIGNWRLDSIIGEGGMGSVYLARHQSLGIPVAVKVLSDALTHDAGARERFFQEARTQAQLVHPRIVQVIDYLQQDDRWFLLSEYLLGGSLESHLEGENGPVDLARAVGWTRQALEALDFAHRQGVIHRDVKPSNLLLDAEGGIKVTDFGIAVILGGRRLTRTGVSLGTPHYMSPEQIRRPKDVDHRADVYSMALVLYELLAGRVPFDSETGSDFDVQYAQIHATPPPLREFNPQVPAALEAVVAKALAKEPDDRYSGCGAFAQALLEVVSRPGDAEDPGGGPPPSFGPNGQGDGEADSRLLAARDRMRTLRAWVGFLSAILVLCLIALFVSCGELEEARDETSRSRRQESTTDSDLRAAQQAAEAAELEVEAVKRIASRATDRAEKAEARLASLESLARARAWPIAAAEDFVANRYGWTTGQQDNDFQEISISISNRRYLVSSTAKKGFQRRLFADLGTSRDFLVEVEAGISSCSHTCSYGIQLRVDSQSNYYLFEVENNAFRVRLWHRSEWKTLMDRTTSPHIRTTNSNRLAVLAEGNRLRFFINDNLVADLTDDTLHSGGAYPAIGLYSAGHSGEFWFDDFVLRRTP